VIHFPIPVLGFAAHSGTGKTSLLEKIIPLLNAHGLRVAVIKHSHHAIQLDKEGKDSYRLSQAGADAVLLACPNSLALQVRHRQPVEPCLSEALRLLRSEDYDLVLVEGFRDESFAKIEIYRALAARPGRGRLYQHDKNIIAVVTDQAIVDTPLPVIPLNDTPAVAAFVLSFISNH